MIHKKGGGALRGLQINREILILRKPPIEVLLNASVKYTWKELIKLRGNA